MHINKVNLKKIKLENKIKFFILINKNLVSRKAEILKKKIPHTEKVIHKLGDLEAT